MDTERFNTPASFSYSQGGIPIANALLNSQMQIISPGVNTISSLSSNGDDFGGFDIFIETEVKEAYIENPEKFLA